MDPADSDPKNPKPSRSRCRHFPRIQALSTYQCSLSTTSGTPCLSQSWRACTLRHLRTPARLRWAGPSEQNIAWKTPHEPGLRLVSDESRSILATNLSGEASNIPLIIRIRPSKEAPPPKVRVRTEEIEP